MKKSIVNGENRGSVNNILLKALQSGDKYGYEINKEIEVKSKGKYFIKEASLYSGLKRLEANGFITSYWKDGELGIRRHYYSITESGLQKLNNSNFNWENSKEELISDLFKSQKPKDNNNQFVSAENTQNITNNNNVENKNNVTKNPFAYVVSENQQSMFSMFEDQNQNAQTSPTEKIEEQQKTTENNESGEVKQTSIFDLENKVLESKTTEEKVNNETTIQTQVTLLNNDNTPKQTIFDTSNLNITNEDNNEEIKVQKIDNLESIKRQFTTKNYLNSSSKDNNINIFDYLQNREIENSIVYTKDKEQPENSVKQNTSNINFNVEKQEEKHEELLEGKFTTVNEQKEEKQEAVFEEKVEYNKEIIEEVGGSHSASKQTSFEDIKNIFGNLLTENEIKEEIDMVEEPYEKEELQVEVVKKELPRIDSDNDVNITLNPTKKAVNTYTEQISNNNTNSTTTQNYSYSQPVQPKTQSSTNINSYCPHQAQSNTSIRQYSSEKIRPSLSKSKQFEESIDLSGIKVRHYQKMNNRKIKSKNYIYINKLNLWLYSLLFISVLITSILGFVFARSTFSCAYYIAFILVGAILLYFNINNYNKDKYKVAIKKNNFKNSIFYSILIFIIIVIMLVCLNILFGMNFSNLNHFVNLLLFEGLVSLNIVLFPILKLLLITNNKFSVV